MVSWTGSNWSCISDNTLTEQQVENYITNDAVNCENSQVGGNRILTTLDQVRSMIPPAWTTKFPRYNQVTLQWECGEDIDLVLSDSEVDTYVENSCT